MSTAVSASLDQQTPLPQEPDIHHPTPKSYAEAAKEGTEEDGGRLLGGADGAPQRLDLHGSAMDSGLRQNLDDDPAICDKHAGQKGEKLTSTKLDESYGAGLQHDAESAPMRKGRPQKRQDATDSKLASGRRAGAGWEKSA